jgi:ATP-dependent Clp protease ATP-binding subunit ClpC
VNRVDEIIVFEALSDEDLRQITEMLIAQLNRNLRDRDLKISMTPEVIDWIILMTCQDRSYGARPLRRAIQRYVEDPLSEELIRGRLENGEVEVYVEGGSLAYRMAGQTVEGRPLA